MPEALTQSTIKEPVINEVVDAVPFDDQTIVAMSNRERLFHTVLFELVALILMTLAAIVITGEAPLKMGLMALTLSFIAMAWNLIFNKVFDHYFGHDRINRSLKLRIGHGFAFEAGMIVFSIPVIMLMLNLGFWQVLLMDIGFVTFFLIYAIIFNWVYDVLRHRLQSGVL